MSPRPSSILTLLALMLLPGPSFAQSLDRAGKPTTPAYKLSGPYTHDNLSIFFIHGKDEISDRTILTLDEALKDKKVIVHETKNVGQLAIENVSGDSVFVQAGDIVKGGQQDRVLAVDLLVPPKSGKLQITSFCVEKDRWNKRDLEDEKAFGSSKDNLIGNRLKLATRYSRNQGQVWRGVDMYQSQLERTLKAPVKDERSESSLQLTLENRKLNEAITTTVKKLEPNFDKQKDVIGYAAVINGKVNNADIYASSELFRKLWPKLLKCSAIEAVAEKKEGKVPAIKAETVLHFLTEADKGKLTQKATNKELLERMKETDANVLFETYAEKAILRRSYLAK